MIRYTIPILNNKYIDAMCLIDNLKGGGMKIKVKYWMRSVIWVMKETIIKKGSSIWRKEKMNFY